MSLLLQAGGRTVDCPRVNLQEFSPSRAVELMFNERESISGGVCVGGPSEWLDLGWEHLQVSAVAMVIAVLVTVPIGLWLGHIRRGEFLAVSVSNVGRAVPSLALLAFFIAFLGVGFANVTVVLVLLAIPPILTNTYVGVRQVDPETVDAARGVGLTEAQIVRQVELPLALTTIFAGVRTSAVAVVATATIAPLANVPSLGTPILEPQTYGDAGQLAAAILVALITLAADAGLSVAQRLSAPKGLAADAPAGRRRFTLSTPATTE